MTRQRTDQKLRSWLQTVALAVVSAGLLIPAGARAQDFFGDDFEAFTGVAASETAMLTDEEMDELRGRFLGFFFSVNFAGFVDMDGAAHGSLEVVAGLGDQTESISLGSASVLPGAVPGEALVTDAAGNELGVRAIIADDAFNGSNLIGQISQVPGNGNDIRQVLVINLAVIEAAEADLGLVRDQLGPYFGF